MEEKTSETEAASPGNGNIGIFVRIAQRRRAFYVN